MEVPEWAKAPKGPSRYPSRDLEENSSLGFPGVLRSSSRLLHGEDLGSRTNAAADDAGRGSKDLGSAGDRNPWHGDGPTRYSSLSQRSAEFSKPAGSGGRERHDRSRRRRGRHRSEPPSERPRSARGHYPEVSGRKRTSSAVPAHSAGSDAKVAKLGKTEGDAAAACCMGSKIRMC